MKHPIDEGQQAQDPNELPDQEPDTREPIVLGSQLARAMAMNKSHRKSQPPIPSQLASIEYSRVAGETNLLRFIESPTDQIIRSLIEEWHHTGIEGVEKVRDSLDMSDFYTLYLFAKRATLLAIRSNDPGWAVAGAQSFAFIDQTRMDWRDFTWAVALIAVGLLSTGNDVPATLGEVAVFASTEAQETILRFAADPPTSLHQWGYEIIETRDGTVFADTNSERYEPTSDLVPIALSVADALNADRYHVDSITVRSGLPEVWLRGPHHTEAVAAVGRMLACTSVHACPLPVMEIGMPDHMFLVFIAEMKSSEDADTVALAARTNDREGASLGLSSGSICCIAIARSVVLGVDSIESNESIQRFSHVFHDAVVRGTTGS